MSCLDRQTDCSYIPYTVIGRIVDQSSMPDITQCPSYCAKNPNSHAKLLHLRGEEPESMFVLEGSGELGNSMERCKARRVSQSLLK